MAGIEVLRRGGGEVQSARTPVEGKSPWVAMLLSLIPGLGAAYNGQNIKALVHFVVIVGLWILSDLFQSPIQVASILAGVGFYFFSLYDAYASAQRHRAGLNLQKEEEWLQQFLREHIRLWGGVLVSIGLLAVFNAVLPEHLRQFWPLGLVGVGIYFILRAYQRGLKESREKSNYQTPPPSVIPSNYESSTGNFAQAESPYDR